MSLRKAIFYQIAKEITDYQRYEAGELKVIGYPGYERSDTVVADVMSYGQWLATYKQYPTIKVEGIESNLKVLRLFRDYRPKSIHLFCTQIPSESFDWHTDNENVFLFVVKGMKIVKFRSRNKVLRAGEGVLIPKGREHKAFSQQHTWAVSVGF